MQYTHHDTHKQTDNPVKGSVNLNIKSKQLDWSGPTFLWYHGEFEIWFEILGGFYFLVIFKFQNSAKNKFISK